MRNLVLCILTIFGSLLFTGYKSQVKLPKELPPDVEITYISEGGFVPSYFSIDIRRHTLRVTDRPPEKDSIEWEVQISDDDLKGLYRVFIENKFDSIRPNKDAGVDDGYSRAIALKFDGKRFLAVQGDGVSSTKIHAERFNNIENALENLTKKYHR